MTNEEELIRYKELVEEIKSILSSIKVIKNVKGYIFKTSYFDQPLDILGEIYEEIMKFDKEE